MSQDRTSGQKNQQNTQQEAGQLFSELVEIVARLRGPDGCPWDKEQNQRTLVQYAIEEAYELAEAIESEDQEEIREELGDFLFQVVLQSQVAEDQSSFSIKDVIRNLSEKMIRRHPHVFAEAGPKSIDQIWLKWDQLKKEEAAGKAKPKPLFSYPRNIPALQASHKIGVKTEGYRFDWTNADDVFKKVEEEIGELKDAMKNKNAQELEHEIGDVLFSVSQLARHLNLEAEQCLREGNRRFEKRFSRVLELSGLEKEKFRELSEIEKEKLWEKAKGDLAK